MMVEVARGVIQSMCLYTVAYFAQQMENLKQLPRCDIFNNAVL